MSLLAAINTVTIQNRPLQNAPRSFREYKLVRPHIGHKNLSYRQYFVSALPRFICDKLRLIAAQLAFANRHFWCSMAKKPVLVLRPVRFEDLVLHYPHVFGFFT